MDGRIFCLIRKLGEHPEKNWSIEEMAAVVELSPRRMQKLFRDEVGTPPHVYLRNLRLDKAAKLLTESFVQIKQICFEAGLKNESHFTRDFKERFGLTPREFRRRHWDKKQADAANGNSFASVDINDDLGLGIIIDERPDSR